MSGAGEPGRSRGHCSAGQPRGEGGEGRGARAGAGGVAPARGPGTSPPGAGGGRSPGPGLASRGFARAKGEVGGGVGVLPEAVRTKPEKDARMGRWRFCYALFLWHRGGTLLEIAAVNSGRWLLRGSGSAGTVTNQKMATIPMATMESTTTGTTLTMRKKAKPSCYVVFPSRLQRTM